MATYKTKAIVLSSYPYRDHDKIICFYSSDYGRIEARARGSRKIISKLAGHLEPFLLVELMLAHGKRWDILAGSRTISAQKQIRSNVDLLACASVCVEAVKHISKPLSADIKIYNLLTDVLNLLEENKLTLSEKKHLVISFLWKTVCLSGFAPEINNCIHSRKKVEKGYFSFEGGGMLSGEFSHQDSGSVYLEEKELESLRRADFRESDKLHNLVLDFWKKVVDHADLKSFNFLQNVLN